MALCNNGLRSGSLAKGVAKNVEVVMDRQLDPRLFGDTVEKQSSEEGSLLPNLERLPQDPSQLRAQLKKNDNMELKMEAFISKISEAHRVMSADLIKLEKRFGRLEQHYKSSHDSMQTRVQKTDMRMTERTMMENKIQALIERQNTMMQNFERKLNAVKKSLDEKEIENMKLSATLKEAHHDIRRIKER